MTGRFAGKTAIVTGASRGIGFAIAERLVADGANVAITARKEDELEAAAARLGDRSRVLAIAGKADDTAHQRDTVARTLRSFGSIDFLVNNAGINPAYGPLVDLDGDAARKIFQVNCLAAVQWVQETYRAWMSGHGGAIVNISSVGGILPPPSIGFYGASKAMLTHLTRQLAVELGPTIRVNSVAPAVVKTKFASALYEGREQEAAETYPLKRLGVPDDVGSAVAYLLSDEASWVTGHELVVDGGVTLTGGVE